MPYHVIPAARFCHHHHLTNEETEAGRRAPKVGCEPRSSDHEFGVLCFSPHCLPPRSQIPQRFLGNEFVPIQCPKYKGNSLQNCFICFVLFAVCSLHGRAVN